MKKLFLTLALAFVGILSANAQLWVGGSASIFARPGHQRIGFAPEAGYSIENTPYTVACALNFDYAHNDDYGMSSGTQDFVLSPYVRYSVCSIEKFDIFADLTFDFALKGKNDQGNARYRIGLQPGVAFKATEHWIAAFRFSFFGYDGLDYAKRNRGFKFDIAAVAPAFGLFYIF